MPINSDGLNILTTSEGLELKAYPDPGTGAQPFTIGFGTTVYPNGTPVRLGDTITREQAIQYLNHDLSNFEKGILDLVNVPLNENQLSALLSFVYNIGPSAFASSTLLKFLNKSDFNGAANQFSRWNKANGKILPGLTIRRDKEKQLFLKSLPSVPSFLVSKVLTILNDTYLKKVFDNNISPIPQASSLPNNQKKLVKASTKINYLAYTKIQNHYLITFDEALTADDNNSQYNTWLVFAGDIDFNNDGIPENKKDTSPAQKIIDYLYSKNFKVFTNPGEINIVCLESTNTNFTINSNTPNEFNDLRLIISFINGVPVIISNEIATISPGRFYTLYPLNAQGAANVTYGQHSTWRLGIHKTKDHPALVQVLPLTVTRDLNKDFSRTGDKIFTGLFGINLHHSFGQPKSNIGKASAGCIVGLSVPQHFKFIELVKKDPRYQKNRDFIFTVSVIKGSDIF